MSVCIYVCVRTHTWKKEEENAAINLEAMCTHGDFICMYIFTYLCMYIFTYTTRIHLYIYLHLSISLSFSRHIPMTLLACSWHFSWQSARKPLSHCIGPPFHIFCVCIHACVVCVYVFVCVCVVFSNSQIFIYSCNFAIQPANAFKPKYSPRVCV